MLLFLVICYFSLECNLVFSTSIEEQNAFMTWKLEFHVDYDSNETETRAFRNFCINRKRIETHNDKYFACNSSYALGLWKRSDVNTTAVNSELNGLEPQLEISGRAIFFLSGIKIEDANVTYLNYVERGYVTGVQDQGTFEKPTNLLCFALLKLIKR